jgi:hypothetical protein
MHVLINVKSPNNISKWQMGFNSAFKGLSNNVVYIGLIQDVNVKGLQVIIRKFVNARFSSAQSFCAILSGRTCVHQLPYNFIPCSSPV